MLMLCAILQNDGSEEQAINLVAELIQDRIRKHSSFALAASSKSMVNTEQITLLSALEACGGNPTLAAKALGISRVTLWRKLKEYQNS